MSDVHPRKVTARVDLKAFSRPQSRSRPASPSKLSPTSSLSPPPFHPKAKVNSSATVRKPASSGSLDVSRANNVTTSSQSRPASPSKPPWMLANGSQPSSSPKARVTARPTSRPRMSPVQTNLGSLEPRQRAHTTASPKLKLPHPDDRPRSGSVVALHHALSISDLNAPPSPTASPFSEPPSIDVGRSNPPPAPAPIKIKSKVTGIINSTSSNAADSASRSLSPPYATTCPIHARARTSSITTSFSLNDPPPSTFYPITTASAAANPHRYASRRAPSPPRAYPPPMFSGEAHTAKKPPLAPKIDPAAVSLPPHSPPISALSLSSRSSVSRTPVSLNSEQTTDYHVPNVVSHVRNMERSNYSSPLVPQAEVMPTTRRDRSHSKERSPRDLVHPDDSDAESDGSERQLRAEAKTNRKIADLEITNRSLLAINVSLETTKNRQAKEIRDLRRKLRESRLILPPRTYKAVKSAAAEVDDKDGDDDDDDTDDEDEDEDETFQRVKGVIDSLIESGKRALETRSEDFRASLATKVLNADELRSWRGSGQRASMGNSHVDKQDADDETIHSQPSLALNAMRDSRSSSPVESDEELASDTLASSLPPITITHPS